MSEAIPVMGTTRIDSTQNHQIDLSIDQAQHDGLVRSTLMGVRGISQEDAEDAVQNAWLVLAEKAKNLEPGPVGGYLRGTARYKAMNIRERSRKTTSLDALTEVTGDSAEVLADPRFDSLSSHLELFELADDPIAARALDAAQKGASACLAPRGASHRCSRYSDEQVEQVRKLRRRGLTYKHIEEATGVPRGYCAQLVKRKSRVTETTEGWTSQLVIDAIRRFYERYGRAPRHRDAVGNLAMPSPRTVSRLFGSWREAVRAAGIEPAYGERRIKPWANAEMVLAFCDWRLRHGRWPNRGDMVADPALPSPATTRRHFRTQSPQRLVKTVLSQLA